MGCNTNQFLSITNPRVIYFYFRDEVKAYSLEILTVGLNKINSNLFKH